MGGFWNEIVDNCDTYADNICSFVHIWLVLPIGTCAKQVSFVPSIDVCIDLWWMQSVVEKYDCKNKIGIAFESKVLWYNFFL